MQDVVLGIEQTPYILYLWGKHQGSISQNPMSKVYAHGVSFAGAFCRVGQQKELAKNPTSGFYEWSSAD
jgi:hypothetical protein